MTAQPRRRWFPRSYGLRTLFVVMAVCGVLTYWLPRELAIRRAREHCEQTSAAWDADTVTTKEACEASLQLFNAEAAMPFSRHSAAVAHLNRVERFFNRDYGPVGEWMQGVSNDAELAEAKARKAEIERYLADAQRTAAENP